MNGVLVGALDLMTLLQAPVTWGLAVGALGLWLVFAARGTSTRRLGALIGLAGLVTLFIALPPVTEAGGANQWIGQAVFWFLATIAVGCSAAATTAQKPVYTAIWFAGSLLGVAGLFMFQHAQFLGVATIVVYAGAIVVTFLFVLMLASPGGHAQYDRVSWGKLPLPLMIFAAAALVAVVATAFVQHPVVVHDAGKGVAESNHMARLGGELFSRHLIAVEIAGTILLVALVGAVAIVIQGKEKRVADGDSRMETAR